MVSFRPLAKTAGRLRTLLFVTAMAAALIGLVLLGVAFLNTGQYDWNPVRIPVPAASGGSAGGTFVAEIDGAYEVVLEFASVLPEPEMRALLKRDGEESAADISWMVSQEGATVAAGGSRVHLYYSTGGRTLLGRIRRLLYSIPFHRERGSFVQVIGRFNSRAGMPYEISMERHALDDAVRETSPVLGLQLSREFWAQHSRGMQSFGTAGLIFLGLSAILFTAWFALLLRQGWLLRKAT